MLGRKAFIHTMESIIAAVLVFGYFMLISSSSLPQEDTDEQITNYVQEAFTSLERTGMLKDLAASENITSLSDEMSSVLPARIKFAVKAVFLNSTIGEVTTATHAMRNISVNLTNCTLNSAYLYVWLSNISQPNITLNERIVTVSEGNYSRFTVTSYLTNGTNTLNISVSGVSSAVKVKYEMKVETEKAVGSAPTDEKVRVADYFVSGKDGKFKPTRFYVYWWQ